MENQNNQEKNNWNKWVQNNRAKIEKFSDYQVQLKIEKAKTKRVLIILGVSLTLSLVWMFLFYNATQSGAFKSELFCGNQTVLVTPTCEQVSCGDIDLPDVSCDCPSFPKNIQVECNGNLGTTGGGS